MLIIKWEVMAHFTAKLITTLNKIRNIWEAAFRSNDLAEKERKSQAQNNSHTRQKRVRTCPHSHAANA